MFSATYSDKDIVKKPTNTPFATRYIKVGDPNILLQATRKRVAINHRHYEYYWLHC